jgi:hypothetical protein
MFFREDGHAVINRHHQTSPVAPWPLVAFSSAAGKRRPSQSSGLFCPTAIYFGPIGSQRPCVDDYPAENTLVTFK